MGNGKRRRISVLAIPLLSLVSACSDPESGLAHIEGDRIHPNAVDRNKDGSYAYDFADPRQALLALIEALNNGDLDLLKKVAGEERASLGIFDPFAEGIIDERMRSRWAVNAYTVQGIEFKGNAATLSVYRQESEGGAFHPYTIEFANVDGRWQYLSYSIHPGVPDKFRRTKAP